MRFIALLILIAIPATSFTQDLQDLLNQQLAGKEEINYTLATFKATRIVTGQSIENPEKGDLMFVVSHRFGTLNKGFYNFFGLDNANTRIGLEHGISERIALGLGRNVFGKTWDGFVKVKLLRQSTGVKNMPVSVSLYASTDIETVKPIDPEISYTLANKMSYTTQLLLARKFSPKISLQLSPAYIHRNLVPRRLDQNDIFIVGAGGRYKLTNRVALNAEYYYLLPGQTADDYTNSFSVGFDIETGGHIFQLILSNSTGIFDRSFISETSGRWIDGDIHFGFNITRVFNLY